MRLLLLASFVAAALAQGTNIFANLCRVDEFRFNCNVVICSLVVM